MFIIMIFNKKHNRENYVDVNRLSDIRKIDILEDPQFYDVITYNNDENPYKEGQRNGLAKCLDNCNGNCVEFGVSGIAFCYPNK